MQPGTRELNEKRGQINWLMGHVSTKSQYNYDVDCEWWRSYLNLRSASIQTARHLYIYKHVLSVHNAGSTRGEASMAKREARIDVSLETSRISRYDTFTLHTLVKVGKHDTQQVMPMVYRQSIFRFVR